LIWQPPEQPDRGQRDPGFIEIGDWAKANDVSGFDNLLEICFD
jgi:hypothetical protein